MKRLGHPSFVALNDEQVRKRATNHLPRDGVPPEVLEVFQEEMGEGDTPLDSKLQPQKAAAPCDAPLADIHAAGDAFAAERPRVVVAEGYSKLDAHEAERRVLQKLASDLAPGHGESQHGGLRTLEVRASNRLLDMFRPCYWSVAFCFLFKHATAEPDVVNSAQPRSSEQISRRQLGNSRAPQVGIRAWAAAMQRQVCPALWNYLFRTVINLEPNSSMYAVPQENGKGRRMCRRSTNISTAPTMSIVKMWTQHVNGDLTKLRHVPGLSPAARKVLSNVEARTRKVPGPMKYEAPCGIRPTHIGRTTDWRCSSLFPLRSAIPALWCAWRALGKAIQLSRQNPLSCVSSTP